MKNRLITGLTTGFCLIFVLGFGVYSVNQTTQSPYRLLRADANEDTSILNLILAGDFDSKPTGAKQIISNQYNATDAIVLQLVFSGGAATSNTFSWRIYAWRKDNGPAEYIAHGTGALGTQAVVKYPHDGSTANNKYWADTLTITDQAWIKTVGTADNGGDGRMAKLVFDFCGYEWIYVEITNADGTTGIEAGDISVYYSYFN